MTAPAAFRHDPVKSVLAGSADGSHDWGAEPAVCGYRKLTYDNRTLGKTINVPVSASPAVVSGLGVVVAADDGFVRLFDAPLRREFWRRRLDSSIYASVVVDQADRTLVVAATSGQLQCVDLRGTLVWSAHAEGQICATPVVTDKSRVLVVPIFPGRCLGIAVDTGTIVFDREVPAPWYAAHGGVAGHRDPYASPLPTPDGGAIVCAGETVLSLDADGGQVWRRDVDAGIKASPVFARATGEVIAFTTAGQCVFLDAATGRVNGVLELGTKITASPAVSGDVIAVGGQGNVSYGVDSIRREVRWRSDQCAPKSYTSFTVLPNGDFVAVNERGNVVCLERAGGRFRWESSQVLGLVDHEPAMDTTPVAAPDGNMYCASYDGDVYRFLFKPIPGNHHVE
ncbi:outer membrane protein assembly factor BamB family protein [Actinokineospora xionganensis]|uniref:PQQ-binding-like beta-propeller repeat protein n=1 Tax=Actinokineospora xionganensis TaxID=2684470 RepID=A0ABR7KZZ6_9PSEU|nr:PQQ-binding-like beta-propeller repeat protein [Actinokineospora xionganensis]MBC6446009.1 PQQ-binding-like beta-propeller repeat protein [Actinokineospora xionganensis]